MRIYDFEGKKNISGERIREARLKLRLSQSDLAARVQIEGVTMERDSISRIEIGTRFIPDYEIPVFARVLGVSALWLLGLQAVCYYNRQKGGKRIEQAKKETRQQGRAGQLLKPCYRNPKPRDCYSTADRKAHRVKGRGRNPPCPPRITRNALNVKRP